MTTEIQYYVVLSNVNRIPEYLLGDSKQVMCIKYVYYFNHKYEYTKIYYDDIVLHRQNKKPISYIIIFISPTEELLTYLKLLDVSVLLRDLVHGYDLYKELHQADYYTSKFVDVI